MLQSFTVLAVVGRLGAIGHSGEKVSRPIPRIPRTILGSRWAVEGDGDCWRGLEGMRPNMSKPSWKLGSFFGAAGATHSDLESSSISFSISTIDRANRDGLRGAEGRVGGSTGADGDANMTW